MEKAVRRRITRKPTADTLAELQHALLSLQDGLSETMARTALLCDGLCGILAVREVAGNSRSIGRKLSGDANLIMRRRRGFRK